MSCARTGVAINSAATTPTPIATFFSIAAALPAIGYLLTGIINSGLDAAAWYSPKSQWRGDRRPA
jgi:hypothetical protein